VVARIILMKYTQNKEKLVSFPVGGRHAGDHFFKTRVLNPNTLEPGNAP
jgi:hypothetical protein